MVTVWLLIVIFTGGHKISDFLEEYIISAKDMAEWRIV